jgi:DNA-binding NarL/FixJ family response regulator
MVRLRTVALTGTAVSLVYLRDVTRVLLAEDSFIVREGIRMLLEATEAVELVAAAEDFDELMAAVADHAPDVVITDIRMPPTRSDEGIRAALEIRESHPETGVVVLSQYAEPGYVFHLFEHGTAGLAYLLKERVGDLEELLAAIDQVARGGSVIDPKVVEVLVAARAAKAGSKLDRLTPREQEVLEHVAEGKTNAAIARDLYLSERAVEKHINSIFTKLDLSFEEDVNKRVRAVVLWLAEH